MKSKLKKWFAMISALIMMICTMTPMTALADLVTSETQTCTFKILYVDSSFNIGYNYGNSWDVDYTCAYTTGHSGYNHTINCSVIKTQVERAETLVDEGYEIKGWTKTASANPTVYTTYTGTTATQTAPYTIYIVAERANVTYTLNYNANGGAGAPTAQTITSSTGTATFTISSTEPTRDGYEFLGWSLSSEATSADYQPGGSITVSSTPTTLYAVWKEASVKKDYTIYKVFSGITDGGMIPSDYTLNYSIADNGGSGTLAKTSDSLTEVNGSVALKWVVTATVPNDSAVNTDVSFSESNYVIDGYSWSSNYFDSNGETKRTIQGGNLQATDYLYNTYVKNQVEPEADWSGLSIEKEADRTTVNPGDTIHYTIKVENNTGVDLSNITVEDVLDSNLVYVSATGGNYENNQWTISSLANGESASLTITATVKDNVVVGTTIANTANITAAVAGDESLPEGTSPSDQADVTVEETTVDPEPSEPGTSEKVSEPGMEKIVVDESGNQIDINDSVSANSGDKISFELKSTIPEDLQDETYIAYEYENGEAIGTVKDGAEYNLVFHDVMEGDLSLSKDDSGNAELSVQINDKNIESDYYELSENCSDGCTFEVTVDLLKLYTAHIINESDFGVTEIQVVYSALLSENASAGVSTNTAYVTYPNTEDPDTPSKSEEDKVEVITYSIKIFKYDKEDSTRGLGNAEFALYSDEDCKTIVKDKLVSDEDGYVLIEGLAEGTYYLKEEKAPVGYVASNTPITVGITKDATTKGEGEDTYRIDVSFANAAIPSTGGAGTMMYTAFGIIIIAVAGVLFIVSRRKKEE